MSSNHLEELAKEYYEYKGYFVKTNIKFNRLKGGGYGGEADVLAYNPKEKDLIHIECNASAPSDGQIKNDAERKFPRDLDYEKVLNIEIRTIDRVFIVGQTGVSKQDLMPAEVINMTMKEFITKVDNEIEGDYMTKAIPETYPLLRTIQFLKWAKNEK